MGGRWDLPNRVATPTEIKEIAGPTQSDDADWRRDVFARKKRGPCVGKTKSGKGTKVMLLTDTDGTPIGVDVESASPHEVNLIERLLHRSQMRLRRRCRLLYDKAADSEPLRRRLRERGICLIAPYRHYQGQSRRTLRKSMADRYRNRWKVERTIGWLKQYRRLAMRWEYHAHLFEGFWQLGCLFTILKRL